jgi:hypothetical protein
MDLTGSRLVLEGSLAVPATEIEVAPRPVRSDVVAPRVLRFTAFPDVITSGESLGLCYEVANGTDVRIDPDVGEVDPARRHCVRASPAETTTYTLTAQTASGESVRQRVLVRVDPGNPSPRAPAADRASILIFSPRPGSIATGAPMSLCYALSGAVHARIEPAVGEVDPASSLKCVRVTPSRTTTYELTAYGRDDYRVTRQVVIVAR